MRPDTFFSEYGYLLQRLIQRDFRRRYHHSYLGILWSVVAPLLQFVSMRFIFLHLVGRNTPHYSTFLFAGLIVYNYFAESTKTGMTALVQNRTILEKIDVPHVLFLLSKTCAVFLNFVLTLLVFFVLAPKGLSASGL